MSLRPLFVAFVASLAIYASFCLGAFGRVHAQADPTDAIEGVAPSGPLPLSITISGGVSLGSYEAGYLYYLTRFLQDNPEHYQLKAVTGASAGSINGFIMLLSYCSAPVNTPQDSLFWKTWIPIGLDALYVKEDVSPVAVFSRRSFSKVVQSLDFAWQQGLNDTCDMVFGVATTRLHPKTQTGVIAELDLPRTEEKFLMHVQGRGMGRAPHISNYADPDFKGEQALLPFDGGHDSDFEPIQQALLASSAFPLAFAPQPVRHCISDPRNEAPTRCDHSRAVEDDFIDGGIFDNQPLRTAMRAIRGGLSFDTQGQATWRATPDWNKGSAHEKAAYLYLDPDVTSFPKRASKNAKESQDSVIAFAGHITGSLVKAARSKDLVSLFEEYPELRERMALLRANFPTVSNELAAFMGFFEQDFRRFDFYLGMYDAYHSLSSAHGLELMQVSTPGVRYPMGKTKDSNWAAFHCLRKVLDRESQSSQACSGTELQNMRIMLQIALDRLYAQCATVPRDTPLNHHPHCFAAQHGSKPPRVPHVTVKEQTPWKHYADEGNLDHTLRLLKRYHFHFSDLGLKPEEAGQARRAIRRKLGGIIEQFAKVQSKDNQLVRVAGRMAINSLHYLPPRHRVHFLLGGGIEAGYSYGLPDAEVLRLLAAVEISGLPTLLSSESNYIGFAPHLGMEFEPAAWNTATLQFRFGLGIGYLFSTVDSFHIDDCTTEDATQRPCSRFFTRAYVGLSIIELLRLQLGMTYAPKFDHHDGGIWQIIPSLGVEYGWY